MSATPAPEHQEPTNHLLRHRHRAPAGAGVKALTAAARSGLRPSLDPDASARRVHTPAEKRKTKLRTSLDRPRSFRDDLRHRQHDLQNRIDQLAAGPRNRGTEQVLNGLRGQLADVNGDIARLDKVQHTLNEVGAKGYLLGIDPAGDGKAIIAVGNPDLA